MAFRQTSGKITVDSSSGVSATFNLPGASIPGSVVFVEISAYQSSASSGATAVTFGGQTMTLDVVGTITPSSAKEKAQIWRVNNTGTGTTVVVTVPAFNYLSMSATEHVGIGTLDKTALLEGNSTTPSATSAVTSSANQLVIGALAVSGGGVRTMSNTSGLTDDFIESDSSLHQEGAGGFKYVTSVGAQTVSWVRSVAEAWAAVIATYTLVGGTTHATSGVLTGAGSTASGTSAHNIAHATTGVLVGSASVIVGAARLSNHKTTGILVGSASVVVGAAASVHTHLTSGVLTGATSTIAGSSSRLTPGASHATSGSLVGSPSTVAGSSSRSTLVTHANTGALVGASSTLVGVSTVTKIHAAAAALVGSTSTLAGVSAVKKIHAAVAALVGSTSTLAGSAARGSVINHALAVDFMNAGGSTLSTPAMTTSATGSIIIASVGRGAISDFATSTVSDNKGNGNYTKQGATNAYVGFPTSGTALYAKINAAGGTGHIVIASKPTPTDEVTLVTTEVPGVNTIVDSKWNATANAATNTSSTVTTTGPATLVAFWWGEDGSGNLDFSALSTGWTLLDKTSSLASNHVQTGSAIRQVAGAGTYSITWTPTTSQAAQLYIVAMQQSVGVTHATTGSLTGAGSTLSGSANRIRQFATSGNIAGSASTLIATANRLRSFSNSGSLVGQQASVAALARKNSAHSSSGSLIGSPSLLTGNANRFRSIATSGSLSGQGSTLFGTAQRNVLHVTSGTLIGQPSFVSGTSARSNGPTLHVASGSLIGNPSILSGASNRIHLFATSGVLVGSTSLVASSANRTRFHNTLGTLVAASSIIIASSSRVRVFTSSAALSGSGSLIAGSSNRASTAVPHTTSGVLLSAASTIAAAANRVGALVSHATSGSLISTNAVISASSARTTVHATSGAMLGSAAIASGTSARTRVHDAGGSLIGSAAIIVSTSARTTVHSTSGALTGTSSTIAALALDNKNHIASGLLVGTQSAVSATADRKHLFASSGILVGTGATSTGTVSRPNAIFLLTPRIKLRTGNLKNKIAKVVVTKVSGKKLYKIEKIISE